jgi:hypothetical protein
VSGAFGGSKDMGGKGERGEEGKKKKKREKRRKKWGRERKVEQEKAKQIDS